MNKKELLDLTIKLLELNYIEEISETQEKKCIIFFHGDLVNINDTDYIVKLYYLKKENSINIMYYNPEYYKEHVNRVYSEYGIPQEKDEYITCNIKNIDNKVIEVISNAKTIYETLEINLKNFLEDKNLSSVIADKSYKTINLYLKNKPQNTLNINLYDIIRINIEPENNMKIKLYYCGIHKGFKAECCIDFKNIMENNNLDLLNIIKKSLKQGLVDEIASQLRENYYNKKNNI